MEQKKILAAKVSKEKKDPPKVHLPKRKVSPKNASKSTAVHQATEKPTALVKTLRTKAIAATNADDKGRRRLAEAQAQRPRSMATQTESGADSHSRSQAFTGMHVEPTPAQFQQQPRLLDLLLERQTEPAHEHLFDFLLDQRPDLLEQRLTDLLQQRELPEFLLDQLPILLKQSPGLLQRQLSDFARQPLLELLQQQLPVLLFRHRPDLLPPHLLYVLNERQFSIYHQQRMTSIRQHQAEEFEQLRLDVVKHLRLNPAEALKFIMPNQLRERPELGFFEEPQLTQREGLQLTSHQEPFGPHSRVGTQAGNNNDAIVPAADNNHNRKYDLTGRRYTALEDIIALAMFKVPALARYSLVAAALGRDEASVKSRMQKLERLSPECRHKLRRICVEEEAHASTHWVEFCDVSSHEESPKFKDGELPTPRNIMSIAEAVLIHPELGELTV